MTTVSPSGRQSFSTAASKAHLRIDPRHVAVPFAVETVEQPLRGNLAACDDVADDLGVGDEDELGHLSFTRRMFPDAPT